MSERGVAYYYTLAWWIEEDRPPKQGDPWSSARGKDNDHKGVAERIIQEQERNDPCLDNGNTQDVWVRKRGEKKWRKFKVTKRVVETYDAEEVTE